jgi:hypothetical protein
VHGVENDRAALTMRPVIDEVREAVEKGSPSTPY